MLFPKRKESACSMRLLFLVLCFMTFWSGEALPSYLSKVELEAIYGLFQQHRPINQRVAAGLQGRKSADSLPYCPAKQGSGWNCSNPNRKVGLCDICWQRAGATAGAYRAWEATRQAQDTWWAEHPCFVTEVSNFLSEFHEFLPSGYHYDKHFLSCYLASHYDKCLEVLMAAMEGRIESESRKKTRRAQKEAELQKRAWFLGISHPRFQTSAQDPLDVASSPFHFAQNSLEDLMTLSHTWVQSDFSPRGDP